MWRHVGDNPRFIVLDEKKSTGNISANNNQDLSTSGNGTCAKTEDSSDGLGLGNQRTIHKLRQQKSWLWQYGLWSFPAMGIKLERFLH